MKEICTLLVKLHIIFSRMQRVNQHARPSIIQVGCPTCCYQVCALDHANGGAADLDYGSEHCHRNVCLVLTWDLMWMTRMGNNGTAGSISERRHSSLVLYHWSSQPRIFRHLMLPLLCNYWNFHNSWISYLLEMLPRKMRWYILIILPFICFQHVFSRRLHTGHRQRGRPSYLFWTGCSEPGNSGQRIGGKQLGCWFNTHR